MNVEELQKELKNTHGPVFVVTDDEETNETWEVGEIEWTGDELHIHVVPYSESLKERAEEAILEALDKAKEAGLDLVDVRQIVEDNLG